MPLLPNPWSPIPPALSLRNLSRHFAGDAGVHDLTLDVARGELLALVGASGSGKTTTLRLVAGYEAPDAGRILITGPDGASRDITGLQPERRDFGMVFQHYALFPHMTVGENVAFGLEARGVSRADRRARAVEALAGVGLEGAADRAVQSLSGGEQQRVALARALIIEPSVLLLDEPLSNLDPTLRRAMRDELRATLRRLGVTALFVTHDQEDAFAIADRLALLRRGRLLQVGAPEELYDRPASREVAEFIGHGTLVPARLTGDGSHLVITLDGVERTLHWVAPMPLGPRDVLAVLRPDALAFATPDAADAWPGVVTARRFAGALFAYRVRLRDTVEVELYSSERAISEGDRVAVRIAHEPVPVVAA